ncbi:MAG: D-alanyl-D-alanine carboxypeptidase family protein [Bacillota bacterium]
MIRKALISVAVFFMVFFIFLPDKLLAQPEISAEAAILMDMETGQVLYQKNPDQRMYPASTTKILTAMLAIKSGNFSDRVKISRNAASVDGSHVGLQEDEVVSLEDLLYIMMLASGNDAATAIAEHIGGSVEEFARAMNREARAIGAMNSNFANPHGLHDPNHYTTARDLATIAREAMRNSVFRKIVGTYHYRNHRVLPRPVNGVPQEDFVNLNKLLWEGYTFEYRGANGIKTGYTDEARRTLVSSAKRGDRELLAVVMKAELEGVYLDSIKLLDYGFNDFKQVELVQSGAEITRAPVKGGQSDDIGVLAAGGFHYNLPVNDVGRIDRKINLDGKISAPVSKGQKVGTMSFVRDGKVIGSVDLVSDRDVEKNPLFRWWYGLVVLAVIFIYLRAQARARRRRYLLRKRKWV